MKRKYVIVRTYSAGVEVGELVERNGKEVVLANSRKLWQWQGAFTLHEVATSGVGKGTRISAQVSEAVVTEAIVVSMVRVRYPHLFANITAHMSQE